MKHSKLSKAISALIASALIVTSPPPFTIKVSAESQTTTSINESQFDHFTITDTTISGLPAKIVKAYTSDGTYIASASASYSGVDNNGVGYGWGWGRTYTISPECSGNNESGYVAPFLAYGTTQTYSVTLSQGGGSSSGGSPVSSWSKTTSFSLTGTYKAPTITVEALTETSVKVSYTAGSPATDAKLTGSLTSSGSSSKSISVASGGSQILTGLSKGTTYTVTTWENLAGIRSSSYTTYTITMPSSCSTPVVTATRNSFTSLTASWSSVTGASNYTVAYGTTSACSTGTFTTSNTSYTINNLTAGKTYYVKVMANPESSSYIASAYSTVVSVKLYDTLSTPSVSLSNVSYTSMTVSWNSISNASSYIVEWASNSSFSGASSKIVSTTSTSLTELSMGTTYYVRVMASSNSSSYKASSYSTVRSATTSSIITLSTPSPTVTANSQTQITVSWSSISNAQNYTLQYATNSSFSSSTTLTVTGTSKVITGLSANTTYYVRMTANTTASGYQSSGYSSTKSVTTPKIVIATPTLATVEPINSTSLQITFDTVDNANQYIIEYSTDSSFSTKQTLTLNN